MTTLKKTSMKTFTEHLLGLIFNLNNQITLHLLYAFPAPSSYLHHLKTLPVCLYFGNKRMAL